MIIEIITQGFYVYLRTHGVGKIREENPTQGKTEINYNIFL